MSNNNKANSVDSHSLDRLPGQEFEETATPVVEENEPTPLQPKRAIPYAPVPMSFHISQSRASDGEMLVSLHIQTPEGDKVFFLNPDIGKQLGDALIKISEASANGIVYSD